MDFVSECFQPYNGLFTVLVLTCGCYWILVVAGFFGVEILDFGAEAEAELDLDAGVDAADLGSVGLIGGFMRFMHFHEVPFMMVITVASTVLWLMFALLNFHWNTQHTWAFALTWVIPTMVSSFAVSKIVLQPLVYLFRQVDIPEKKLRDYVGGECVVMTSLVDEKFGTAEIETQESPIVVQIRNRSSFKFSKGDRAVLEKYSSAGRYFEIGPQKNSIT